MTRAFVAVDISREARRALAAYLDDCRDRFPDFRWVPPENLHLTLRFLGEVPPKRLEDLKAQLPGVPQAPFEVELDEVGTFGGARMPRVIWLGVGRGGDELKVLARATEAACRRLGFEDESRPFRPHLTLARSRERFGAILGELPEPPRLPAWKVNEVVVYQSQLKPGGAVYTPLHRAPLGT